MGRSDWQRRVIGWGVLLVTLGATHAPGQNGEGTMPNSEQAARQQLLGLGRVLAGYLRNTGTMPTPRDLLDSGWLMAPATLMAPGDTRTVPPAEDIGTGGSYVFATALTDEPRMRMIWERHAYRGSERLVLYSDWSIESEPGDPPSGLSKFSLTTIDWSRLRIPSAWMTLLQNRILLYLLGGCFLFLALCLHRMAAIAGAQGQWMAYLPLLNSILLCRIAGRSGWWCLSLLVPVVNIIMFFVILLGVARTMGRGAPSAMLAMVPGMILLVLPYWALRGRAITTARTAGTTPTARPSRFCIACGEAIPNEASFCPGCGQALGTKAQPSVPTPDASQPQTGTHRAPIAGELVWATRFWKVVIWLMVLGVAVWAYWRNSQASTPQLLATSGTSSKDSGTASLPAPIDAPPLAPDSEHASNPMPTSDDFAVMPVNVIVQQPDPASDRDRGYGFADDFTDQVRPLLIQAIREGRGTFTYSNASGTDSIEIDITGMSEGDVEAFLTELVRLR